jgi:hypothetical protein
MKLHQITLLAVLALLLGGCATSSGVDLTGDTLMLGEVRHVWTRELYESGRISSTDEPRDLSRLMPANAFTDAQLDAGRLLVVRVLIYWNNTASGIVRDQVYVVLADEGQTVRAGSVVEFTASNFVKRVRTQNLADGSCYYGNVPVGETVELLGGISRVGPRGSASLYCKGIELEGWHRPRTFWHKLPDAVPGAAPIDEPPIKVRAPA